MAKDTAEQVKTLTDFSAGIQRKSTKFIKQSTDIKDGNNIRFFRTGGISKAPGYSKKGNSLEVTNTTTSSTTSTSTSTSTSSSTSSSSTSSSSTTTMA